MASIVDKVVTYLSAGIENAVYFVGSLLPSKEGTEIEHGETESVTLLLSQEVEVKGEAEEGSDKLGKKVSELGEKVSEQVSYVYGKVTDSLPAKEEVKEKIEEGAETIKDKAKALSENTKEKLSDAKDTIAEKLSVKGEEIKEQAEEVKHKIHKAGKKAKEKVSDVDDSIKEKLSSHEEIKEATKKKIHQVESKVDELSEKAGDKLADTSEKVAEVWDMLLHSYHNHSAKSGGGMPLNIAELLSIESTHNPVQHSSTASITLPINLLPEASPVASDF